MNMKRDRKGTADQDTRLARHKIIMLTQGDAKNIRFGKVRNDGTRNATWEVNGVKASVSYLTDL